METAYFPTGLADGDAFLGREEQTLRLANNIRDGQHSLTLAPRRFGKTSLIRHTLKKLKLPYASVDLFLAIDAYAIERRLMAGIEQLIYTVSESPEQWLHTLLLYFRQAKKQWTVGLKGMQLVLTPENRTDSAENILNALYALEHVLAKKKQRAVLFIDEFQEINKLKETKGIEGAIRHFAQSANYLVFIFSGSSQHLLMDMFGDRTRPLYALCDWINIGRLPETLYRHYLDKIAQKTGKKLLSKACFDTIMALTERHPQAVYALCGNLWRTALGKKKILTHEDVTLAWAEYVKERLKQTRNLLSSLNNSQIKTLILIANGKQTALTGKEAQRSLNLTSPSIVSALNQLATQDLIEEYEPHTYRIINPVVSSTLVDYYTGYLT